MKRTTKKSTSGGKAETFTYGDVVQEKDNYQLYESGMYTVKKKPEPEPEPPRKSFKEEEFVRKQRKSYGQVIQEKNNYSLYEGGDLTEKIREKKMVEVDEEPKKKLKSKPHTNCPICLRELLHKCPQCGKKIKEEETEEKKEFKANTLRKQGKKKVVKKEKKLNRSYDEGLQEPEIVGDRKVFTFQTKNRVRRTYEYADDFEENDGY